MTPIYLEPAMVPAVLRGSYSGKKFKAVVTESVTINADAGLWSGGTRDYWSGVNASTGAAMPLPGQASSPWAEGRQEQTVTLEPGFVVVKHSMFCGKDMGLTFFVHPDNAAKLLPAPATELTANEQLVINGTCMYKSSYGGKDRYQMTCESYSHDPLMTRAEWEEAKQSLISKGLLNKAGAITPAGRNARA